MTAVEGVGGGVTKAGAAGEVNEGGGADPPFPTGDKPTSAHEVGGKTCRKFVQQMAPAGAIPPPWQHIEPGSA